MSEVTLEMVARLPRPGMAFPSSFAFSRDGSLLTFLDAPEGGLRRVLCAMDVATGERRVLFDPGAGVTDSNVSREEALRRERAREMTTGVTSYAWASDADLMLVPVAEEAWLVGPDGSARIVARDAFAPCLSPDGSRLAFVRRGDVYVAEVASGTESRLTDDATDGVSNGLAEYCAQEELGRRSGMWWSPDGARLAFQLTDERHVPTFRIPHWGTDDADEVETHRYPFAGMPNAIVRIAVADLANEMTTEIDLPQGAEYLARADWHPDGRLFVQTLDRAQRRLTLSAYDVESGTRAELIVEEQEPWVNVHDDLRFVEPSGEFVWSSERTGLRQLYLYDAHGTLRGAITRHDFPVDRVIAVDVAGRRVAYAAATTQPEAQVFVAGLDGDEPRPIGEGRGAHSAEFSRDFAQRVVISTSVAQPPRVTVNERTLHEPEKIDLPAPELFTFVARDGAELNALRYVPAHLPAPVLVRVYGGPHVNVVSDSWVSTVDLRAQYLAQRGFLVISVDNRGSARRGLAFEAPIHLRMGTIEIDDQVDGVRHAQRQGWVDGQRVGMYGWSYGGYMTILSMLKASDVFKVGVAGAPVTDWAGYDTCYTERYMSTPQENPDGYREASALTHAANLRGRLMIVHGMIDENVHFRHTARLLRAFAEHNKDVDLLAYPEERHSPRSERDRRNMEERIARYFEEHL